MSTEGRWRATFWKYGTGGTNQNVGFIQSYSGSDSLEVDANVIYPATISCDYVLISGTDATVAVDVYWYR